LWSLTLHEEEDDGAGAVSGKRAPPANRSQTFQEGLAAKCGMHRTYISHLETMRSNVTLDTLDMLAETLGTEPAALLAAQDV
jgi:transcriptional regulator with XRE-family HTH domain